MPFAPESQIELAPPYVLTYQHPVTGNRVNGLGFNVANGGTTPSHVGNPDGGSDTVVRTRAAASNAESELIFNLAYLPTDWDLQGIGAPQEAFDDLTIEARVRLNWQGIAALPSRIQGILSFFDDAGTTRIGSIAMANGGRIRIDDSVTGNTSTPTIEISENTWHTITARYKASSGATDGLIEVWVDGVSRLVHVHNNTTLVGRAGCGSRNTGFGANNIDLFIRHVAFVRQSTLDRFTDLAIGDLMVRDPAMGILLDVSSDAISIGCHWHPSVHDDAWRTGDDVVFDLEYVAGIFDDGNFPGSGTSVTGTVALPSADEWCGVNTITGLGAGTAYSARVRAYPSASGPGSAYLGPVLNFTTMPTSPGTIRFGHYFCQQPEFYGHVTGRLLADNNVRFAVSAGDEFYNDSTPQAATHPSATKQSFLRALTQVYTRNPFKALQGRRVPTFMQPDDHDVCENNWDQSYVLGFSTAYNLGGLSGTARTSAADDSILAGAAYTKGDVYDAGGQAWHALVAAGYLNPAYAGASWHDRAHHRKIILPNCLGLLLDTRRFQDAIGTEPFSDGVETFLGPHQLDWVQAEIAASTSPGLILFSPSNVSDLHVLNDGWHTRALWEAELHLIESWALANPFIEWMYVISGDRHATALDQRNKDGQYGRSGYANPKMVASIRVGPAGAGAVPSFFGETITDDVDFTTTFGATAAGRPAKGFGVIDLDTTTGQMTVQVIESDTGNAIYSKVYVPQSGEGGAPTGVRGSRMRLNRVRV